MEINAKIGATTIEIEEDSINEWVSTRVEYEVDSHIENVDFQDLVNDVVYGMDFSDYLDTGDEVDSQIRSLLQDYVRTTSLCSVGTDFLSAVEHSLTFDECTNKIKEIVEKAIEENTQPVTLDTDEGPIREIVRQEIRSILFGTLSNGESESSDAVQGS
tara:strand:- start:90 stop:566 length:477 start_codon:yes stop_codon:yes gene_type:complete